MEKHQVLALKYRPASFDTLIGQESVVQTLSLALTGERLSHAYLFSGLRGSGKTSTARIFAKALVCDKGPTATPCGVCEQCLNAHQNRHIDIIEMDAASNRGIDDIRELIESTKYKPNMARFKIFIIDEVHMLTTQAFNALLKTLEEPPSYVKFILATTDPLKLPPTILSRTQHFRFKQIKQADVVNHLCHILHLENVEYEKEAIEMLARAGNGSLRDTLTLLDQAIIYAKGFITPHAVATMLGLLNPEEVHRLFDAILHKDRNSLIAQIKELERYECEIVLDECIVYLKNAFFEADRRFSTLVYERFFKILSEAKSLLHINANSGFVLALVFFKMVEATQIKSVEEMIEALEKEKFRLPEPSATTPTHQTLTPALATQEHPSTQTLFAQLRQKLFDRNFELGECFEQCITLLSYESPLLKLQSSADESQSKILKNSSGIIKHFVQELFGLETKIEILKKTPPPQESQQEEHDGGSCIAEQSGVSAKALDVMEIMNHPFVQKAQELFDPKRIEIHPKV